jgi:hydrogenase/urease accessory protein HupE
MAQSLLRILKPMFRSHLLRTFVFLSATAAAAQAHPGHPGHEDDPYRMEGLTVPFPELGYFLPLLALGACIALLEGRQRTVLCTATAGLLGLTAWFHLSQPSALIGLLASATCALAAGAVLGRAGRALRRSRQVPQVQPVAEPRAQR